MPVIDLSPFEKEEYCYLTTKGRKTGNPHEIEIWFVVYENSLYLMSGNLDKSDWVRNLLKDSNVTLRIAGKLFSAVASLLENHSVEQKIRTAMAFKYNEWEEGELSEWAKTALVVKFTPV